MIDYVLKHDIKLFIYIITNKHWQIFWLDTYVMIQKY